MMIPHVTHTIYLCKECAHNEPCVLITGAEDSKPTDCPYHSHILEAGVQAEAAPVPVWEVV